MNENITGKVYVLGDNIDTDQIIPAQYLNLVPTIPDEYEKLGSYAMIGLPDEFPPFVEEGETKTEYAVIVASKNFGCGSSREHAPIALGAAGVAAVVAESYARIFFRNSVATGELFPCESEEDLTEVFKTDDEIEIDLGTSVVTHVASGRTFNLKALGPVAPVVEAGGIFQYARQTGMIEKKLAERETKRLEREEAFDHAERKTKVVAVANQKGGVGKTTTSINLAASLADLGKKVLLIDLDPQCNATSGVGVDQEAGKSIYGALLGEQTIEELIKRTPFKNLDLIPAEVDLAGAEIDVAREEHYLRRFKESLRPLLEDEIYDYVIVDCPPSLGILTMNGLTAADSVLIPLQCEYYALEGLSVITKLINEIRTTGVNHRIELEGIVMTMYDSRTKLSAQVVDEVQKHFGDKVYENVIPRNVRLGEAPSYGIPAVQFDKHSKGAKAYRKFTAEFLKRG